MSNVIKIVMSGYLDENDKLMNRGELNERISNIQQQNKDFREALEEIREEGTSKHSMVMSRRVLDKHKEESND